MFVSFFLGSRSPLVTGGLSPIQAIKRWIVAGLIGTIVPQVFPECRPKTKQYGH
jgi:hypothetical protein